MARMRYLYGMTLTEEVHDLDVPVREPVKTPKLQQWLPWAVAGVSLVVAALAVAPRPAPPVEPEPAAVVDVDTSQDTDVWVYHRNVNGDPVQIVPPFLDDTLTCKTITDGSVTIEERGENPSGHLVTGTDLAVCVWLR